MKAYDPPRWYEDENGGWDLVAGDETVLGSVYPDAGRWAWRVGRGDPQHAATANDGKALVIKAVLAAYYERSPAR
jgi:hypothetical protein